MPAHDAEAIADRRFQLAAIELAVRPARNPGKRRGPRVRLSHHDQQLADLVDVADHFRSHDEILAAQPDPDRDAGFQVQLPSAAARRQQDLPVAESAICGLFGEVPGPRLTPSQFGERDQRRRRW